MVRTSIAKLFILFIDVCVWLKITAQLEAHTKFNFHYTSKTLGSIIKLLTICKTTHVIMA
jgi:hypothetical protein